MKTKKLKPNQNNIETFLPIFSGFYGSIWNEPDFYGEAEHYELPKDFDFISYINWDDYKNALSKYFCRCIESELSEYIEIIEFQRLHSPKYYNFENDSIYCIIRPKKNVIKDYILSHKIDFIKYLKDHLTTRDGFISHHSNDFKDWELTTKNFTRFDKKYDNNGFNLGFILSFIAENENLEELDVFMEADNYVSISEFLNEEFYEIIETLETKNPFINRDNFINARKSGDEIPDLNKAIESIKKFVRNNYIYGNVKDLAINKFENADIKFYDPLSDFIYIEKIIDYQVKEIENQTMELQLK